MSYGYIYKTTNLVNNRIYIGQKKGQFNSDYYGSGLILKQAFKKEGRNNFRLEIIIYAKDRDRLNELEKYYIIKYRELFGNKIYNITDGGTGGDNFTNHPNKELIREKLRRHSTGKKFGPPSEETKLKMRLAKLGIKQTEETILKRIQSRKENGRSWHTRNSKIKISNSESGKFVSKKTKQKLRIASRKRWDNYGDSEETKLKKRRSQRRRRLRESLELTNV